MFLGIAQESTINLTKKVIKFVNLGKLKDKYLRIINKIFKNAWIDILKKVAEKSVNNLFTHFNIGFS